jgi:biotin transport system ATP-binding protein
MTTKPIVDVRNVTKVFPVVDAEGRRGRFVALDSVSFAVEAGECLIGAGANGSGKSVLMHLIAGLDAPTSGTVTVGGRVGLVFQDADSQLLGETPREDVAIGLAHPSSAAVEGALAEVGLADKADFPARSLSGGEKRRLAVAGILALGCPVVIFDEPYAALDYPGVLQVNALIRGLLRDGKTVIILTHELEKCLALGHRLLVLHQGRLAFHGTPSEGLAQPLEAWGVRTPPGPLEGMAW